MYSPNSSSGAPVRWYASPMVRQSDGASVRLRPFGSKGEEVECGISTVSLLGMRDIFLRGHPHRPLWGHLPFQRGGHSFLMKNSALTFFPLEGDVPERSGGDGGGANENQEYKKLYPRHPKHPYFKILFCGGPDVDVRCSQKSGIGFGRCGVTAYVKRIWD